MRDLTYPPIIWTALTGFKALGQTFQMRGTENVPRTGGVLLAFNHVSYVDFIYGGWGPDEMQADIGGAGKQGDTDQLIDWTGPHNVYYVCGGAYGQGRIIRTSSPAMMEMLTRLAEASGSRELTTNGTGGWFDLGMVYNQDKNDNNDRSPEHPGHFTCG